MSRVGGNNSGFLLSQSDHHLVKVKLLAMLPSTGSGLINMDPIESKENDLEGDMQDKG